jgi:hypothetical protein
MRANLVAYALLLVCACHLSPADTQATETDSVAAGSCVTSQVLSGNVSPGSLILLCSSALVTLTEQLIIDAIDAFTAQHTTDAGLAAMPSWLTPQQSQFLQTARLNAVASLAAKATSK